MKHFRDCRDFFEEDPHDVLSLSGISGSKQGLTYLDDFERRKIYRPTDSQLFAYIRQRDAHSGQTRPNILLKSVIPPSGSVPIVCSAVGAGSGFVIGS